MPTRGKIEVALWVAVGVLLAWEVADSVREHGWPFALLAAAISLAAAVLIVRLARLWRR